MAFEHSSAKRASTDNVVCAITLDNGTVGYGEAIPRQYVTGESVASVWSTLQALELEPRGAVSSIAEALAIAETVTASIPDSAEVIQNACRAAVELAILDAYGRAFATSLTTPLTLYCGTQPGSVCPHSLVIDRDLPRHPDRLRLLQERYGFRAAKVKVGFGEQEDLDHIAAVRDVLGPDGDIRLDANRAWTYEAALSVMTQARKLGVTVVEDPVQGDTIDDQVGPLRRLREHGVKVVLDEPIRTLEEAARAIEQGAVDVLNLRVSKNGGLIRSCRLAKYAQDHGVGLQVGTQVGETAILSAAGRHLAYCAGPVIFMEGSNEHMKFEREHYVSVEDLNYDEHATSQPLTRPGLGITILPEQLDRFTTDRFGKELT